MKPRLIDHKNSYNKNFWLSSFGRIGASFRCTAIDLELVNPDLLERQLENALKHLSDELYIKWHLLSSVESSRHNQHARAEVIEIIGQTRLDLIVHFEIKANTLLKNLKSVARIQNKDFFDEGITHLNDLLPLTDLKEIGLNPVSLTPEEINAYFPVTESPITYRQYGIDTGLDCIGVLKLHKLANYPISYQTFATLKDSLPSPFEIVLHQRKYSKLSTENRIDRMSKRESTPQNARELEIATESQETQRDVSLRGEAHFGFELHVLLPRLDEAALKNDLNISLRKLAPIGEFLIESIGAEPSYISTLPGSPFHFAGMFESLTEKDSKLPCYMPIFTRGNPKSKPHHPGSFAFHRYDFTVDFFTIYDSRYKNYCVNLVGNSGTGKSVFLNRFINCAAQSPRSKTIIVDVAGSHTRLVNALGGQTFSIELSRPSGINVFSYLKDNWNESSISNISTFVADLMMEEDETRLSEEMMFDLNAALLDYAEKRRDSPSLNDFISLLPDSFPRKKLLLRFSSRGLHRHLFSDSDSERRDSQLIYYNFVHIDVAANRSASKAIMSAIMAEVNFALQNKAPGDEVVFINDESPFFIESNFSSYNYLSKNMRKLSGALVFAVQVSHNLIVSGDSSLIDNAGTAIFLSYDGSVDSFASRFKMQPEEMSLVKNLKSVKGAYTQFIVKDEIGLRTGHLILHDREYWESTTEGKEQATLKRLKQEFPELEEETLITILGAARTSSKRNNSDESKIERGV